MNKVIRTTWIILLLTVASGMARAQQGLQIASVFQKYGKQKRSDYGRAVQRNAGNLPDDSL